MSCVRHKHKLLFCYLKKIYQLIRLCYILKEDLGKISVSVNVPILGHYSGILLEEGGGVQKFP